MEIDELDTLLRRADQLERPVPVETLIERSMRNGRRRARNRRLTTIGALAGCLAAVVIIAGLALAPGPSVSMSPAATPEPSEIVPTRTGSLPTTTELKKIIKAELPERMITRNFSTEGQWGAGIAYELGDRDGYGHAAVGIDRLSWTTDPTCTPSSLGTCETRTVAARHGVDRPGPREVRRCDPLQPGPAQRHPSVVLPTKRAERPGRPPGPPVVGRRGHRVDHRPGLARPRRPPAYRSPRDPLSASPDRQRGRYKLGWSVEATLIASGPLRWSVGDVSKFGWSVDTTFQPKPVFTCTIPLYGTRAFRVEDLRHRTEAAREEVGLLLLPTLPSSLGNWTSARRSSHNCLRQTPHSASSRAFAS